MKISNSLKRYLKYVDENDVDIGICLGDSVSTNCDDDTNYFWTNALQISKPIYYNIGNHDDGIDNYKSLDSNKLYDLYIKQMLENNYLEEKNLNNKSCYYYRDVVSLDRYPV